MDAKERAEKMFSHIVNILDLQMGEMREPLHVLVRDCIASQISEAERETEIKFLTNGSYRKKAYERGFAEGFSSARDKAAGIVQKWIDDDCVGNNPAIRIRALSPEK